MDKDIKKDLEEKVEYAKKQVETENKSIYDTKIYQNYEKKEKFFFEGFTKVFNAQKTLSVALIILLIFSIVFAIYKMNSDESEKSLFSAYSNKKVSSESDKEKAINDSLKNIKNAYDNNQILDPTNLNLINRYDEVKDEEDKLNEASMNSSVRPKTLVEAEVDITPMDSVAGQVFTKLIGKYNTFKNLIFNYSDTRPVTIVREQNLDGTKILGQYNPDDTTHNINKPITWFINNFTNVNINFKNGDGEDIGEYTNIKDIMSMANVYTYYHDPYDIDTFLNYCYNLYDSSLSYTLSLSDVYYCTGCMHYEGNIATSSYVNYDNVKNPTFTYVKEPNEQKLKEQDVKKTGIINRMDSENLEVNNDTFENYINNLNENSDKYNNYCPGHIDLIVNVKALTLNETNGLTSIDTIGNKGTNWTYNWHGWDILKKSKAIELANKDWEETYGLSISYISLLKPLKQEEINYYLSKLDKNISKERYEVIETALKSVGRIPYYYAGKPRTKGFGARNNFGTKVRADYKGRVLNGLDCSGWTNWVYWTALDKRNISNGGTAKLVKEGKKIRRYELKPGDLIVRPGYDSHVMMFYEWAEDGKMRVIHENGSVNNVSIAVVEGYYPYYRNVLD